LPTARQESEEMFRKNGLLHHNVMIAVGLPSCRGFLWCRNPMLMFGVLPSVDVVCEECCRCMQRCWFPQTLPTRQSSRCMSTDLTPE